MWGKTKYRGCLLPFDLSVAQPLLTIYYYLSNRKFRLCPQSDINVCDIVRVYTRAMSARVSSASRFHYLGPNKNTDSRVLVFYCAREVVNKTFRSIL